MAFTDHVSLRGDQLCKKSGNTGARQTAAFGVAEVYAHLRLWVRRARAFVDKGSHSKDFKPTNAGLQAYISEHGWDSPA